MIHVYTTIHQVIQYREQSNLAFALLVKSQESDNRISLEKLLEFPLAPVPHALGTLDGFFAKTKKSAMVHHVLKANTSVIIDNSLLDNRERIWIKDGNVLFYELSNLSANLGGVCFAILDQMIAKKNFIFSMDSYHELSIKGSERLRRGGTADRIIVGGAATRTPADFKYFLSNTDNKKQLSKLLLEVWSSDAAASRIKNVPKTAAVVMDGAFYTLVEHEAKVV